MIYDIGRPHFQTSSPLTKTKKKNSSKNERINQEFSGLLYIGIGDVQDGFFFLEEEVLKFWPADLRFHT